MAAGRRGLHRGSVLTSNPLPGTAIDFQPGEDVVCTYSNAKNGMISVTKNAVGATAGDTFAFAGDLGEHRQRPIAFCGFCGRHVPRLRNRSRRLGPLRHRLHRAER